MAPFFPAISSFLFDSVQAASSIVSRGWGNDIKWVSLKEGQRMAKEQQKPAMVVIHKTWCPACKALRPKFAENAEIAKLSQNFIMINCENEEEPQTSDFKPDGGYIPRIIFMNPDGKVLNHICNQTDSRHKYYYPHPTPIVDSMKKVLRMY
jgi:protein-disulfide reductase (glutathione)